MFKSTRSDAVARANMTRLSSCVRWKTAHLMSIKNGGFKTNDADWAETAGICSWRIELSTLKSKAFFLDCAWRVLGAWSDQALSAQSASSVLNRPFLMPAVGP